MMEATESTNELQNSEKTHQKIGRKPKNAAEGSSRKWSVTNTPRTRSQVAPDWTTKEALILVNVIATVEGDCLKVLSAYQKWKIIVGHCAKLGVSRTSNQCRSKWKSLLAEYEQVKQWDSQFKSDSYWLMDCEKRKQFQLPENFEYDLFKAIDDYVRAKMDHSDTDPDTDPEAEADLLNVIAKLGPKKQKQRPVAPKTQPEEKPQNCLTMEQPQQIHVEEESQKSCKEENPQMCCEKEKPQIVHVKEEPQKSHVEEKPQESCRKANPQKTNAEPQKSLEEEKPKTKRGRKKKIIQVEETEQMMVERSCENVELIRAIAQESHVGEKSQESCRKENPQKTNAEPQKSLEEEKPKTKRGRKKKIIQVEETEKMMVERLCENAELIHAIAQESHVEEKPQESCRKENPQKTNAEPQKSLEEEKPKSKRGRKKKIVGMEESEQMMVERLCENAELILAIAQGNIPEIADFGGNNSKNVEDFKTDFVRRQGDKLIACLGDIVDILGQFPHLVQERD